MFAYPTIIQEHYENSTLKSTLVTVASWWYRHREV